MMLCWAVLLSLLGVASANIKVMTMHNKTLENFFSLEAAFGPPFDRRSRVLGYMRLADPEDACTEIAPPLVKRNRPWFVLIARTPERHNCPFDKKVLNAQKAGYKGAVIYNVPGSDDIIVMHGDSMARNVTIPSQFIGYEDSRTMLRKYIQTPTQQWMYIFELNGLRPELPDPYFYIIPFFVVICIIVIILVIALIVKLCREYFHSRRSRLSKRNLKKLPTKKFVKNVDPYETCAVCLDDFEDGDKIRILPCNHAYHCQCIDPWLLKRKRSCPVCKRKIHFGRKRRDTPTADPDSSDSGDERTPLLGATAGAGPSTPATSSAVGAINSAYVAVEEPRSASYGSINPALRTSGSPTTSTEDHRVEIHAPPAPAAAAAPATETNEAGETGETAKPAAEIV